MILGDSTIAVGHRLMAGDIGELVIGAADGDDRAWDELVNRFAGLVDAVTTAHRLSDEDAARVVATVWLRLGRNLSRIRQPDRVGAWLGAVARDESVRALPAAGFDAA